MDYFSTDFIQFESKKSDISLSCLEDEGIDVGSPTEREISSDRSDISGPTTPNVISVASTVGDSGFAHYVDLQCLECVLDTSSTRKRDGVVKCTCASQEHDGFEDYVHDIYMHRLRIESKYHVSACLENQPEISVELRRQHIQWLTTIHHELKLCQDTLYLAVNIFDRVLDVMQVSRDCVELLGITCLLVAGKQNEICAPEIQELLLKCHDQFSRDQVKQLEMIVLMATSFDLVAPTVQQFLEYFAAFSLTMCVADKEQTFRLKMARTVGRCILELSLQEYELCRFQPSVLALCVWKVAVTYLKTYVDCTCIQRTLKQDFQYHEACYKRVDQFINNFRHTYPDVSSFCEKYANLYEGKFM